MYLPLELCTEIPPYFKWETEEAKVTWQMLPDALKATFKISPRTCVKKGREKSRLVLHAQTDPLNETAF